MSKPFQLRAADERDRQSVFDWRNDPWIVAICASQQTVRWEDHVRWFERVLTSGNHLLFIIESNQGQGIGILRFDREGTEAEITIHLLQPFTGKGYGVSVLTEGCSRAFEHWPDLENIKARIRHDNPNSVKAFLKAGFSHDESNSSDMFQMAQPRPSTINH